MQRGRGAEDCALNLADKSCQPSEPTETGPDHRLAADNSAYRAWPILAENGVAGDPGMQISVGLAEAQVSIRHACPVGSGTIGTTAAKCRSNDPPRGFGPNGSAPRPRTLIRLLGSLVS